MPAIRLTIRNKVGLHARPAALFVQTATKFQCEIRVKNQGKLVNAKSILSVLSMGVKAGEEIIIDAEGADADLALQTLQGLAEANFGEEQ